MRSSRWTAARSLLLLLCMLAATAATAIVSAEKASTRQASSAYLAGNGSEVNCSSLQGGACFNLQSDVLETAITVLDDMGRPPASARFQFVGTGGVILETGAFCDSTKVERPPGASQLRVIVAALDPTGCDQPATGTTGRIIVEMKISEGDFEGRDPHATECLQPTPTAISVAGLTEPEDSGQRVPLGVFVLLDTGVTEERARELMELASQAYTSLGIDMWFHYERVSLPSGGSGNALLSHAADAVGGEVPEGFDIVHSLTNNRPTNVWGQADCIGGVRYPDRAFSISRADLQDRPVSYLGPVQGRIIEHLAANIVAHEIGHTMGGHHHYGNCVETKVTHGEVESCTVMMDPGDPKELVFSALNGAIVRAHAVRYGGSVRVPTAFTDLVASTRGEQVGLTGRLLTEAGQPVAAVTILTRAGDGEWVPATTSDDGSFAVTLNATDHGRSVQVTARFDGYRHLEPTEAITTATWSGRNK